MPNLTLGETYVFAKVDGKAVITSGTDNAHLDVTNIRSDLFVGGDISGSTFVSTGSSNNEGGELQLLPGYASSSVWIVDNYNDTLRIFKRDLDGVSNVENAFRVLPSGFVGLGTTPEYRLHVKADNATGSVVHFENSSTATTAQCVLELESKAVSDGTSITADYLRCIDDHGVERAYIRPKNANGYHAEMWAYAMSCTSLSVAGSKAFQINHPDPKLNATHKLRHTCIEGPTEGDTIYRWQVDVTNNSHSIVLPDYYRFLNKNDMVWISPVDHFGIGHGKVNEQQTSLDIKTSENGMYNVLLIGTRKDKDAVENYPGEVVANEDLEL